MAQRQRAQCFEYVHEIVIHFPLLVVIWRHFRRLVFGCSSGPSPFDPPPLSFFFFFFFFARRDEEIRGRRVRRAAGVCSTYGRAHPRAAAEETVGRGESTHTDRRREAEATRRHATGSRRPDALAAVLLLHACRSSITQTVKDGHVAWRKRGQRTASATTTMTTAAR